MLDEQAFCPAVLAWVSIASSASAYWIVQEIIKLNADNAHLDNPSAILRCQEHVGSLDVSMPDAGLVQVLYSMQHLPQQLLHLPLLQLPPVLH